MVVVYMFGDTTVKQSIDLSAACHILVSLSLPEVHERIEIQNSIMKFPKIHTSTSFNYQPKNNLSLSPESRSVAVSTQKKYPP